MVRDQEPASQGSDGFRYKVAIVAPTCFYYQVPIFRELAADSRIELKVYYCTDEALFGRDVPKKFGTTSQWGIEDDLLAGYEYKFLRNFSPFPSYLKSVIGLMNLGIWREIRKSRPDVVILMSWMNPTWWLAVLACLYSGIPFLYLTDQNLQRDLAAPRWKNWVKRLVLGKILFRITSGFLCAGTANRLLYSYYGVPDSKLIPFAFSWGLQPLLQKADELAAQRNCLRAQMSIPENSFVMLFVGRFSPEKNPLLFLKAYERVNLPGKALVFVGDGHLRESLQQHVDNRQLDSVYFFGFQTRQEIPKYYAIADVLVIPSDRETWGIVVNEAMCFGLPVIASDQVGAALDLVKHGQNGFEFPKGDADELASRIEQLAALTKDERRAMGKRSRELITIWSQRNLAQSLDRYLDRVCVRKIKSQPENEHVQ